MRAKLIGVGAAALLLVLLPFVLDDFRTAQLATVGALFIAILGLDVLTGHTGQISLGHGAFMAIGGYTTAILVANHGVRDVWTIAAAAGVAAAIGLLVGIPALRLPGFYLALVTFGVALVLPTILEKFDHFTGGSTGISFYGSPHQTGHGAGVEILGVHLSSSRWVCALTWTIGAVLFALVWSLLGSRHGRSLRAVRDGELVATASGISRAGYKVAAFGLSAAFAGVAGSLVAINVAYVSPSSFELQLSLYLVVGAVAGFYGSIWGAALGALLIEFLPDVVDSLPNVAATRPGPTTFVFGAILIGLMLALPVVVRVGTVVANRAGPSRTDGGEITNH